LITLAGFARTATSEIMPSVENPPSVRVTLEPGHGVSGCVARADGGPASSIQVMIASGETPIDEAFARSHAAMNFLRATESFEDWLRSQVTVNDKDLQAKHKLMASAKQGLFGFLRATFYRWIQLWPEVCPELAKATQVLAVGDLHLENFGTWRDAEGRLVWGIEDFDESAPIPYPFDLVRLGASALLADTAEGFRPRAIAHALLTGYCAGLAQPHPVILEDAQLWLRDLFSATKKERSEFWEKLEGLDEEKLPKRYVAALHSALPQDGVKDLTFRSRQAGAGSLGRPRFVALGRWRGGPVAREAKALIPSCWLGRQITDRPGRALLRAARGRFKSPDPWLDVHDDVVVRRLGPNSRKLEIEKIGHLRKPVLAAMGFELATIHSDDAGVARRIKADLDARKPKWLAKAIDDVANATIQDWKAFRRSE
jgi:hypothetical protein